jgi:hypothetical protein
MRIAITIINTPINDDIKAIVFLAGMYFSSSTLKNKAIT